MKLSIITVSLNNFTGLEKTSKSVFRQTFSDFEYIVIDGGSVDASREYLLENEDKIAYWISEKDNGVYHAMNKGILQAAGDYLLFLNAGDLLLSDGILKLVFENYQSEDILYGDIKSNVTGNLFNFPKMLRFSFFRNATINHQASFIKRRLFKDFGLYNERYTIAADWEFFIRCIFLHGASTKHLGFATTEFEFNDGISAREENWALMKRERSEILQKYFPGFLEDYEDADKLMQAHIQRNEESLRMNKHFIRLIRKMRRIVNS